MVDSEAEAINASSGALRDVLIRPTVAAAPELLGSRLISDIGRRRVVVRIVETEAYGGVGSDPPSWAHGGMTRANRTMFGSAGHALVRLSYGMHWTLNVVTAEAGTAGAVLIRAGEVLEGVDVAQERRQNARTRHDLARGPARLAVALGVDGSIDGTDLLDGTGPLRLVWSGQTGKVASGPRVGVASATDRPWRFWLEADPHVSRYRPARRR